jgi:hypothetical protein
MQKTIDVTYLYGDWRLAGTFQSDLGQQECPSSRDYHGRSAVVVASRLPCPDERLLAGKTSETEAAAQRGRENTSVLVPLRHLFCHPQTHGSLGRRTHVAALPPTE